MNRDAYPAFVKKIWMDGGHVEKNLAVAGLGLIGECGEVCEAILENDGIIGASNVVDECGDVLYYATVLADWKGYHVADIWPVIRLDSDATSYHAGCSLAANAKEVSERVKKFIRDGKDPDGSEIRAHLRGTLTALERVLQLYGATLHDAMDANVKKLEVRYAHAL